MNDDWDLISSLKHENAELKARNRVVYYFLDEIKDDIQWDHGFGAPSYEKIKKFLDENGD